MTGRGGGGPRSDLKFTTPSECKMVSGGLRSPSRITHQLGKYDLEPKSVFPDATGSHPLMSRCCLVQHSATELHMSTSRMFPPCFVEARRRAPSPIEPNKQLNAIDSNMISAVTKPSGFLF